MHYYKRLLTYTYTLFLKNNYKSLVCIFKLIDQYKISYNGCGESYSDDPPIKKYIIKLLWIVST